MQTCSNVVCDTSTSVSLDLNWMNSKCRTENRLRNGTGYDGGRKEKSVNPHQRQHTHFSAGVEVMKPNKNDLLDGDNSTDDEDTFACDDVGYESGATIESTRLPQDINIDPIPWLPTFDLEDDEEKGRCPSLPRSINSSKTSALFQCEDMTASLTSSWHGGSAKSKSMHIPRSMASSQATTRLQLIKSKSEKISSRQAAASGLGIGNHTTSSVASFQSKKKSTYSSYDACFGHEQKRKIKSKSMHMPSSQSTTRPGELVKSKSEKIYSSRRSELGEARHRHIRRHRSSDETSSRRYLSGSEKKCLRSRNSTSRQEDNLKRSSRTKEGRNRSKSRSCEQHTSCTRYDSRSHKQEDSSKSRRSITSEKKGHRRSESRQKRRDREYESEAQNCRHITDGLRKSRRDNRSNRTKIKQSTPPESKSKDERLQQLSSKEAIKRNSSGQQCDEVNNATDLNIDDPNTTSESESNRREEEIFSASEVGKLQSSNNADTETNSSIEEQKCSRGERTTYFLLKNKPKRGLCYKDVLSESMLDDINNSIHSKSEYGESACNANEENDQVAAAGISIDLDDSNHSFFLGLKRGGGGSRSRLFNRNDSFRSNTSCNSILGKYQVALGSSVRSLPMETLSNKKKLNRNDSFKSLSSHGLLPNYQACLGSSVRSLPMETLSDKKLFNRHDSFRSFSSNSSLLPNYKADLGLSVHSLPIGMNEGLQTSSIHSLQTNTPPKSTEQTKTRSKIPQPIFIRTKSKVDKSTIVADTSNNTPTSSENRSSPCGVLEYENGTHVKNISIDDDMKTKNNTPSSYQYGQSAANEEGTISEADNINDKLYTTSDADGNSMAGIERLNQESKSIKRDAAACFLLKNRAKRGQCYKDFLPESMLDDINNSMHSTKEGENDVNNDKGQVSESAGVSISIDLDDSNHSFFLGMKRAGSRRQLFRRNNSYRCSGGMPKCQGSLGSSVRSLPIEPLNDRGPLNRDDSFRASSGLPNYQIALGSSMRSLPTSTLKNQNCLNSSLHSLPQLETTTSVAAQNKTKTKPKIPQPIFLRSRSKVYGSASTGDKGSSTCITDKSAYGIQISDNNDAKTKRKKAKNVATCDSDNGSYDKKDSEVILKSSTKKLRVVYSKAGLPNYQASHFLNNASNHSLPHVGILPSRSHDLLKCSIHSLPMRIMPSNDDVHSSSVYSLSIEGGCTMSSRNACETRKGPIFRKQVNTNLNTNNESLLRMTITTESPPHDMDGISSCSEKDDDATQDISTKMDNPLSSSDLSDSVTSTNSIHTADASGSEYDKIDNLQFSVGNSHNSECGFDASTASCRDISDIFVEDINHKFSSFDKEGTNQHDCKKDEIISKSHDNDDEDAGGRIKVLINTKKKECICCPSDSNAIVAAMNTTISKSDHTFTKRQSSTPSSASRYSKRNSCLASFDTNKKRYGSSSNSHNRRKSMAASCDRRKSLSFDSNKDKIELLNHNVNVNEKSASCRGVVSSRSGKCSSVTVSKRSIICLSGHADSKRQSVHRSQSGRRNSHDSGHSYSISQQKRKSNTNERNNNSSRKEKIMRGSSRNESSTIDRNNIGRRSRDQHVDPGRHKRTSSDTCEIVVKETSSEMNRMANNLKSYNGKSTASNSRSQKKSG